VVPAGDGAALDAAVGRLLDDRELALRLGATARRTAVSRFSQEIVAAAYFELVRRVTTPQAEA
jgi:glycosyltransferase involved in cell wall biosynthesis